MNHTFDGLRRFPKPIAWLEMGGYFIGFMAISYAVKPELINLNLAPSPSQLLAIALVAFAIPAFTEECVFRGLLTPAFELRWACLSTFAYVVWHPLGAYVFLPAALPLFTDAIFWPWSHC
ncbi:MAG: CPBP family glutamic-type intramembrane protease [Cyanobacteria bacterium P01_D01_bin.123]